MRYYHKEITKEKYEELKTKSELEIFGPSIIYGYGLYGYRLYEGNPETGEGYSMSYSIGETCD